VFLSLDLTACAPLQIAGDDFSTFLMLANTHDGTSALTGTVTPVRVVCQNTLNAALRGGTPTFRIRHTGDIESKIAAARLSLKLTIDYMARFEEVATAAMSIKVSDPKATKVLHRVFAMSPETAAKPDSAVFANHHATKAFDIYQSAEDLAPFRGTAWGLVNAVAEYVDHEKVYGKIRPANADNARTWSVLWGEGQRAITDTLAAVAPKLVPARIAARMGTTD